jgi:hypothetical protein
MCEPSCALTEGPARKSHRSEWQPMRFPSSRRQRGGNRRRHGVARAAALVAALTALAALASSPPAPAPTYSNATPPPRTTCRAVTEHGPAAIKIPRDRRSTFEPRSVCKGQRRFEGFTTRSSRCIRAACRSGTSRRTCPRSTAWRSAATWRPRLPASCSGGAGRRSTTSDQPVIVTRLARMVVTGEPSSSLFHLARGVILPVTATASAASRAAS